jgi:hypothetical protein
MTRVAGQRAEERRVVQPGNPEMRWLVRKPGEHAVPGASCDFATSPDTRSTRGRPFRSRRVVEVLRGARAILANVHGTPRRASDDACASPPSPFSSWPSRPNGPTFRRAGAERSSAPRTPSRCTGRGRSGPTRTTITSRRIRWRTRSRTGSAASRRTSGTAAASCASRTRPSGSSAPCASSTSSRSSGW